MRNVPSRSMQTHPIVVIKRIFILRFRFFLWRHSKAFVNQKLTRPPNTPCTERRIKCASASPQLTTEILNTRITHFHRAQARPFVRTVTLRSRYAEVLLSLPSSLTSLATALCKAPWERKDLNAPIESPIGAVSILGHAQLHGKLVSFS